MKLDYKYGVLVNSVLDTTKNNGNVQSQVITAPNLALTQSYDYDVLNRLGSATETGGTTEWSQTYGYDRYGNRWVSQSLGYTLDMDLCPTQQNQVDAAANRINNLCFMANTCCFATKAYCFETKPIGFVIKADCLVIRTSCLPDKADCLAFNTYLAPSSVVDNETFTGRQRITEYDLAGRAANISTAAVYYAKSISRALYSTGDQNTNARWDSR